ncbi:DUF4388 domain-containing protein [bacterium]|nr:DUF4388 domain-containing protein [bacterium]
MAVPDREAYVKGSLAHLPLPKTLNYIHQAKKTGILALALGPKKAHIHFDNGEIVHVTSSYFADQSLGEFLVQQRKITAEQASASLDATRSGPLKQGMFLIEHGHISPHDLYDALNTHVTLKLYRLFEWPEGDFFFKQGEIIEPEFRVLKIHMGNLIYVGIRDYYPMKTLPLEFRGRKEFPLFRRPDCPYREEDMAFGPMGTRVLSMVNGQHTLRQIVAHSKMKKGQIYKILYAMFLLGFIGFPESVQDRSRQTFRERAQRRGATGADRQGYEVNIADDLIAEAVRSVERIHSTVAAGEPAESADLDLGEPIQKVKAPAAAKAGAGELSLGLDEPHEEPEDDGDDIFGLAPESSSGLGWEDDASGAGAGFDEPDANAYTASFETTDLGAYSTPEELMKQATYLTEESRWDEAERFLRRAIEVDPNWSPAYPHLGWAVYNRSGGVEVAESEAIVKEGLRRDPKNFEAFLILGKIYKAENQVDFAELHFVKAIELNVDCVEAKEEIKKIRASR